MPTNPTIPTPAEILERVKAQDWGHEWVYHGPACDRWQQCKVCGIRLSRGSAKYWCNLRIAQAIQAGMVESLRHAAILARQLQPGAGLMHKSWLQIELAILKAADALEKGVPGET